jgi:hypothetical protein
MALPKILSFFLDINWKWNQHDATKATLGALGGLSRKLTLGCTPWRRRRGVTPKVSFGSTRSNSPSRPSDKKTQFDSAGNS